MLLSRADSEALNLRVEPTPIAPIIETVMERLRPAADARGVALHIEAPSRAPEALLDRDRIEQVLVNLLDNAIKYSRQGGAVHVGLDIDSAGFIRVRVQDEGIGIPRQELPRIGERFYRADRARSRAHGGSGLGLAIARALVEAHGGRLQIESNEGLGTTVSFTLQTA